MTLVKDTIEPKGYSLEEVINCDQSRFDKELHSHRTRTFKGEHHVHVEVGSTNATTHSYMVMPIVTMSGAIIEPMYLKSQETNGK